MKPGLRFEGARGEWSCCYVLKNVRGELALAEFKKRNRSWQKNQVVQKIGIRKGKN